MLGCATTNDGGFRAGLYMWGRSSWRDGEGGVGIQGCSCIGGTVFARWRLTKDSDREIRPLILRIISPGVDTAHERIRIAQCRVRGADESWHAHGGWGAEQRDWEVWPENARFSDDSRGGGEEGGAVWRVASDLLEGREVWHDEGGVGVVWVCANHRWGDTDEGWQGHRGRDHEWTGTEATWRNKQTRTQGVNNQIITCIYNGTSE